MSDLSVAGYSGRFSNPFISSGTGPRVSSNNNYGSHEVAGHQGYKEPVASSMERILEAQKTGLLGSINSGEKVASNNNIDASIFNWAQNGGAPVNHGDGFYNGTVASIFDQMA